VITFEDLGVALCHQKVVPGDTITGLSQYCYQYQRFRLNFTDADAEIAIGDWVIGASSGAVAKVVSVTSTAWTDGVGHLILDSWNGTAFQAEELKVVAGATMANTDGVLIPLTSTNYPYKGMMAKSALVVAFVNTALIDYSGGKPDQTNVIGIPLAAGSSVLLKNIENIRNLKMVNYAAATATTIQVSFCF